jgi:murein endopeptidase
MWDNRATMHRGRPWSAHEARLMVRTTISATEAVCCARRLLFPQRVLAGRLRRSWWDTALMCLNAV